MLAKRRLLLAVASALSLLMAATAPMAAGYKEAAPSPLRQAGLLRVKDIAANGATNKGPIVAVGWHEGSKPGQLYLAFSTDGGKDYRRTNGNLRQYRIVGDTKLGMSLAICAGKVWVGSTFKDAGSGATRVFLTSRTIGGGASQAFVTPGDGRRVRDVSVACVGNKLLAIGWLEKKDGQNRTRLVLRSTGVRGGGARHREEVQVRPRPVQERYRGGGHPGRCPGGLGRRRQPAPQALRCLG